MARHMLLIAAICCVLASTSYAANDIVMIGSNRLEAEMKYWLCSADGEVADVLLHVMAETTINVTAAKRNWTGCANVTCLEEPINGTLALVTLQMNPTTYVRLLEFGHEQAPTCTDPNAAIQDFVNGLINAGCAIRACDINDYVAARPGAASGCMAILAV